MDTARRSTPAVRHSTLRDALAHTLRRSEVRDDAEAGEAPGVERDESVRSRQREPSHVHNGHEQANGARPLPSASLGCATPGCITCTRARQYTHTHKRTHATTRACFVSVRSFRGEMISSSAPLRSTSEPFTSASKPRRGTAPLYVECCMRHLVARLAACCSRRQYRDCRYRSMAELIFASRLSRPAPPPSSHHRYSSVLVCLSGTGANPTCEYEEPIV